MKSVFPSRHFCCFDCQSRILFFFAIWLLFLLVSFDWSVGQNAPWMNQNCFVVTWLMTYVCLHFLHPHRKETYIKKLSNILLTDPQLTWGGNLTDFNFPRFCKKKKLNSLLLSANERSEIFATCRHFDLKSIIWSQSTASHLFARKRSFHRPTSSSLLARWHLMITITSYLHTL